MKETREIIKKLEHLQKVLQGRNRKPDCRATGYYIGTIYIDAINEAIEKIGELSLYEVV